MRGNDAGHDAPVAPGRDAGCMDLLTPSEHTSRCPWKGAAAYWTLSAGGKTLENAAWAYPEPLAELAAIKDYVSFYEAVAVEG